MVQLHKQCVLGLTLGILAGCTAQTPYDRGYISSKTAARTGAVLSDSASAGTFVWPPEANPTDGLSVDEAVATGLWNNADLERSLADLGFARADMIAASKLPNPTLNFLLPGGPSVFEATLGLPIYLLARDGRMDRSRFELERVVAVIEEQALSLARDIHLAHAEVIAAQDRARMRGEFAELSNEMARITDDRHRVGSISNRVAAQIRADAADASARAQMATRDLQLTRNALAQLLGLPRSVSFPSLAPTRLATLQTLDSAILLDEAFSSRPELKAAEAAVMSAGEDAGIERARLLDVVAQVKITKDRGGNAEIGPGAQILLPIFDQNQAGLLRARSAVEQALANHVAAQRLIERQVGDALAELNSAQLNYAKWSADIVPLRQQEAQLTEDAYDLGQVPYFDWALAQKRLLEAQLSLTDTSLELHRARADLERSIGHRMASEDREQ